MLKIYTSVFTLVFVLLLLGGCKEDPCEKVVCQNGQCVEGTCDCDSNFEGHACESLSRDKFLGSWLAGDICNSGSEVYDINLAAPSQEGRIEFDQLGPDRLSVWAEVRGDSLSIPTQAYGLHTISGSGGMDSPQSGITLDFNIDLGSGLTTNCLSSLIAN